MANDVYQLPDMGEPLQDAMRIADSFQYTPEKQPKPFHFLKAIEVERYTARDAAVELGAAEAKPILTAFGFVRPPKLEKLMNDESKLGGEIFGKDKGHLFWLDHKNTTAAQQNQIGDWYHAEPTFLNGKKTLKVLHFVTTPDTIEKRYNGVTYPMHIQEIQDFIHAVEAFMDITRPMYPVDDTIHALQEEMREESEVKTPQERSFDQAIVRRLFDNYYQKKQFQGTIEAQRDEKSHDDLAA